MKTIVELYISAIDLELNDNCMPYLAVALFSGFYVDPYFFLRTGIMILIEPFIEHPILKW
jgi:hypothetical protein